MCTIHAIPVPTIATFIMPMNVLCKSAVPCYLNREVVFSTQNSWHIDHVDSCITVYDILEINFSLTGYVNDDFFASSFPYVSCQCAGMTIELILHVHVSNINPTLTKKPNVVVFLGEPSYTFHYFVTFFSQLKIGLNSRMVLV